MTFWLWQPVFLSVSDAGIFSNLPRPVVVPSKILPFSMPSFKVHRNTCEKFPEDFPDMAVFSFWEAFADFQKKAKEAHASKYEAELIRRLTPSKWTNNWGIECTDFNRSCCREVYNCIRFLKLCHSAIRYTWYKNILLDKFYASNENNRFALMQYFFKKMILQRVCLEFHP